MRYYNNNNKMFIIPLYKAIQDGQRFFNKIDRSKFSNPRPSSIGVSTLGSRSILALNEREGYL